MPSLSLPYLAPLTAVPLLIAFIACAPTALLIGHHTYNTLQSMGGVCSLDVGTRVHKAYHPFYTRPVPYVSLYLLCMPSFSLSLVPLGLPPCAHSFLPIWVCTRCTVVPDYHLQDIMRSKRHIVQKFENCES